MESKIAERLKAVEARMEALEERAISEQRTKFALVQSLEDKTSERTDEFMNKLNDLNESLTNKIEESSAAQRARMTKRFKQQDEDLEKGL